MNKAFIMINKEELLMNYGRERFSTVENEIAFREYEEILRSEYAELGIDSVEFRYGGADVVGKYSHSVEFEGIEIDEYLDWDFHRADNRAAFIAFEFNDSTSTGAKTNIIDKLLQNTTNKYMIALLAEYRDAQVWEMRALASIVGRDGDLRGQREQLLRLENCISYISEKQFDISGWGLFEIPIFYSHCFWNPSTKQAFDLAVWDIGVVEPRYVDAGANEQKAKSIMDAIENYDVSDYVNAGN